MPNFCLSHKRVKVLSEHADRRFVAGKKPAGGRLRQRCRDLAQGPPDFPMKYWLGPAGERNAPAQARWLRGLQELSVMKFFTGSLAAGLVLLAGSAQAQVPGPYVAASDVETPYAVAPRPVPGPSFVPGPSYEPGPRYGNSPSLLPSTEVYSVLRDNGFSPLGIPRLRGFVYTIAAIDRGGADGRLIIDARNGRIIRFLPAYRMGGDNYYEEQSALHGPFGAQPPQAMARPPQAQPPDPVQAQPRPSRPAPPSPAPRPGPRPTPPHRARPMSRAARCRCRRRARSPPSLRRRRSSRR